MNAPDIVTLTINPAIDVFGVTDEIFSDSKSRCEKASSLPGGGGINVARNIYRMGSSVTAVFPAGGLTGNLLKQLMNEDGTPFVATDIAEETRQNFAITERKGQKMHHFVFPGPQLSEQEYQACHNALFSFAPQPEYLVLTGSLPDNIPNNFYKNITEQANQKGIKVILDTSGEALKESLYAGTYLAKLNRREFASLGFDEHVSIQELAKQMTGLVHDGAVDHLIVTLNRGGAVLVSKNGESYYFEAPSVHIVSHVGAGDSFVSALTHQLNKGASLQQATHYGVAAAAVTVQLEGNQLHDLNWLERMVSEVIAHPLP
ncbi:hypothetical protein CWE15_08730 [Aliidiomarina taiwanensis]|uniref:Phosphofructokinase n=1 Tax=Aliidiomarina taiwanensis TaxID=946228 RepID=A0A432X0Z5_9GAMM|nr:1-phosphofructokinase family hexose kinase [Aliidiomarina taiwanensis]RUO39829.1 hypothetical protein CWE15_08730 [Aliidiomarina taiwanensis]